MAVDPPRWQVEIDALRRELDLYRHMSEAAIEKALRANERRLDLLNEFRAQAADESKNYMRQDAADIQYDRIRELVHRNETRIDACIPRETYNQRHDALGARVFAIEKWQANLMGRYVGLSVVGAIFTAVVTAVIVHLAQGS